MQNLFQRIIAADINSYFARQAGSRREALIALGLGAFNSGNYDISRQIFSAYITDFPSAIEGYFGAAVAAEKMGNLIDAINLMLEGLKRQPGSNSALYQLSKFYDLAGNKEFSAKIKEHLSSVTIKYISDQGEGTSHGYEAYLHDDKKLDVDFSPLFPYLNLSDRILDIGCNNGHILDYFRRKGYSKFGGVEINLAAIDYFRSNYPETYAMSQVRPGDISVELKEIPNHAYDVVYTHWVLTNIPYDEVVSEIARISSRIVYFVETDQQNACLVPSELYFRDFEKLMSAAGFSLLYSEEGDRKITYDRVLWKRIFIRNQ